MRNGSAASISRRAAVSSSRRAIVMLSMGCNQSPALVAADTDPVCTSEEERLKAESNRPIADVRKSAKEVNAQRFIRCIRIQKSLAGLMVDFLETRDLISLRTFCSLDDVEFNLITFLQAFVSLALNGTVVNEDVGSSLAAEKAVALRVIEPLYCAFILCQWNNSLVAFVRPDTA